MAINNISNYKKADDGMALPLSITRGNPNPLDDTYLFKSYADAALYAASDPTAYVGQLIAIVENKQKTDKEGKPVNDEAGNPIMVDEVGAYLIVDSAGTLLELINTQSSGDATLDLAKVKSQIAALEAIIGSGTLDTMATDLISAINELNAGGSSGGTGTSSDIDDLKTLIGTGTLSSGYTDLISAINDLLSGSTATSGGVVSITLETTPNTGCLATYTITQDGDSIGQIDIPKDGDITTISVGLEGVKTDIGALQTDVTGVKTNIGTLQTDVTGVKTDMSGIKSDIGTLQTDVSGVKTDIGTLQTDVSSAKTNINTIQTNIGNIQTQLGTGTLPGGAADIVTAINNLNSKDTTPPEDEWATKSDIDTLYTGLFSGFGW